MTYMEVFGGHIDTFTHLFLLSSGKGTLGTYCEPGAVLGTEETPENELDLHLPSQKFLKKWR